ncbi:glycosyltransferase [Phycicoccus sp. MQZ13P-5]|uniref:D-inositol 3-phosphate glycosyltransferase n=1 Tax=Phycicoccus sonneratiae TaxID=2807628 RepID=A0ABS2CJ89_9MICO|nr:glycosyltransferase [Phycicoccus sonneraticus]
MPDGRTVAVAHDYLTQRGGAERVVLSLAKAFPGAPVHTTLHEPDATYPELAALEVRASSLNRFAPARRSYRSALPLLPFAASSVRPTEDVVVASTSGWAHGFRAEGDVVAYCHAPARWLYQSEAYLGGSLRSSAKGLALAALKPSLLAWDRRAAARPAKYLCNSRVVRDRIGEAYGIEAEVVPPPHSMDVHAPRESVPELEDWAGEGYLLVVSRLLPYKNVDVLVEAVRGTDERLVVVGTGPEKARLQAIAPQNVKMVEGLSEAQLRWVYAQARLLLAPSLEDYGLTPLEAAAFGVPTVSLGAGGYLDTVVDGLTGLFVEAPEVGAFRAGIAEATGRSWDTAAVLAQADAFGEERFGERIREAVSSLRPRQVRTAPARPRVVLGARTPAPAWAARVASGLAIAPATVTD